MQSSQLGKEIWELSNVSSRITRTFPTHRYIIVATHFWFFSPSSASFKGCCWTTHTTKSGRDACAIETSTTSLHTRKHKSQHGEHKVWFWKPEANNSDCSVWNCLAGSGKHRLLRQSCLPHPLTPLSWQEYILLFQFQETMAFASIIWKLQSELQFVPCLPMDWITSIRRKTSALFRM